MRNKLTAIRGLPGSGKTEYAKKYFPGTLHVEADMLSTVGGGYSFDPSKLSERHGACLEIVKLALSAGADVVVSNTFTKVWEIQPYLDAAKELDCDIEVIKTTGKWASIHDVPEKAIEAMKHRWEDVPGERRG